MKRFVLTILIVVVLMAAFSGVVYMRSMPDANAEQLVTKALTHRDHGSYVAEAITTTGHISKVFRTKATIYHDGANELISYDDGKDGAWALTSNQKTYTCLPDQNKLLIVAGSGEITDSERARLLIKNYHPKIVGKQVVAGRKAFIVRLKTLDDNRPSKKLWIDAERKVILKSVDYSASGEKRSEMEVTRIEFDKAIDASHFSVPEDRDWKRHTISVTTDAATVRDALDITVSNPNIVGNGYKRDGTYLYTCQCNCDHRAMQTVYTDGLNTISVFQTPKDFPCDSKACQTDSHGCVLQESEIAKVGQVERGDKLVVVVADLPAEEVRRIAESIE